MFQIRAEERKHSGCQQEAQHKFGKAPPDFPQTVCCEVVGVVPSCSVGKITTGINRDSKG